MEDGAAAAGALRGEPAAMLLVSTARTHHLIGLRNAACLSGIVADCLVSANGVVNDPMATAPGPLSASASD